jgi:hypothetical protein
LRAGLALVPNEAVGFFAIDFAALRSAPGGKELMQSIAQDVGDFEELLEDSLGLPAGDIDRVIGFVYRNSKTSVFSSPVVVLTATGTAPVGRLQARVKQDGKKTVNGTDLYPEATPAGAAISFIDGQTFLVGAERDLEDLLARPRATKSNWESALKLAQEKHLVVAGLQPPEALHQWLNDNLVAHYPDLKPLLGCRQATLAIDLAENAETRIKLSFDFPPQGVPRENARALEAARKLLTEQFRLILIQVKASDPQTEKITRALRSFHTGLENASTAMDGNAVQLTMNVGKADELVAGLTRAGTATMSASRAPVVINRLKQQVHAMHTYLSTIGHLPPAAIRDRNGKPLLSWRVAILPYIEQEELYKQFRLDEPWDSPHNMALLDRMPAIFEGGDGDRAKSPYRVIVGPGTPFEVGKKVTLKDARSSTADLILIVETANSVPWTKPEDIQLSDDRKLPDVNSLLPPRFHAAMGDGSVRAFERGEDILRRIFIDR